jgi:hypothetical protein
VEGQDPQDRYRGRSEPDAKDRGGEGTAWVVSLLGVGQDVHEVFVLADLSGDGPG